MNILSFLKRDKTKPRAVYMPAGRVIASAEGYSYISELTDEEVEHAIDRVERMREAKTEQDSKK